MRPRLAPARTALFGVACLSRVLAVVASCVLVLGSAVPADASDAVGQQARQMTSVDKPDLALPRQPNAAGAELGGVAGFGPTNGGWVTNVIIVGGSGVISDAVALQLEAQTGGEAIRLAGSNRYATASWISRFLFPFGADTVYLATGGNFPDALAGGPAAAYDAAPILLVSSTGLTQETRDELIRLKPSNIVLLGGTGVISDGIAGQAAATTGATVTRLAGPNRYATSAVISAATFGPGVEVAYIVTGDNFPDALAGGPVAGLYGGPVLLVSKSGIPAPVASELARLKPKSIVVLGGTGVVSLAIEQRLMGYTTGSVTRLAGSDRYSTAAQISKAAFSKGVHAVIVATANNFPDALAAGPLGAFGAFPLLLVNQDTIPAPTRNEITRLMPPISNGQTITTLDAQGDVGSFTSLAIGGDGHPSVAYLNRIAPDLSYFSFTHCWDSTCTSRSPTNSFGAQTDVSMTMRSDGNATIAAVGFSHINTFHCANPQCNNTGSHGLWLDPENPVYGQLDLTRVSVVVDAGDHPFFVYPYRNTVGFQTCAEIDCSTSDRSVLAPAEVPGKKMGTHASAAMSTSGYPSVSFYNETDGDLMFYSLDPGFPSPSPVTIDSVGDVGLYTALGYGADGLPVISYYDADNFSLKVAHCNDTGCSSASTTTIDGGFYVAGLFASESSLTIGADGFPIISYYELILPFLGRLKVADCANAACTSGTIIIVDSLADVGASSSIAIGSDGKPIISYYDFWNADAKVAHIG